jgi:cellulose synthase/poly-beta-1,6-N-acetylglucosamine synthase-like glycosyltransferase
VTILVLALTAVAILLFAISSSTLWWMMHAWMSPENYEATSVPPLAPPSHSFSIIVPCRDEPYDVMSATLQRLLDQTVPRIQVVISVGDDDPDTVDRARMLAAMDERVTVSVNCDPVKNKPRQLNSALRDCTGEIVGIMDAESLASVRLLQAVDSTFQATGADVVQGAVHLVNTRSRWFTLRNCLEYRIWFRSRLHGHARAGFIPLGGNTVFVWRSLLAEVGGWDGDCLAEDCELGVRLSAMGKRVVCIYDKDLTTVEEAPVTVKGFLRQRVRWSVGFMQVLAKGEWRRLPTRLERLGARWTLAQQYAMAAAGVLVPVGFLTAVWLKIPTGVALLTYAPLVPLLLTLGFEALVLHDFGVDMKIRVGVRDYAMLVASTFLYQVLLLAAALAAVAKFRRGDFHWDKTQHVGAHLGGTPSRRLPPRRRVRVAPALPVFETRKEPVA